jgi:hypothetical protein
LNNISEVLNLVKTNFKITNKKSNNKLILSNQKQKGGKIKEITIDNTTYTYDIEYGESIDQNFSNYEVQFVTINDYKTKCAVILINKNTKEANIQSVANYNDCIICSDDKIKYKVGDILMQIMLYQCKKFNIKKVSLEDNSKKYFTGASIELIYFRTMTQGLPYYVKFGFKSLYSQLIIRSNNYNFKTDPKLLKDTIIDLFKNTVDISKNKTLYKIFTKTLEKFNDEISIKKYLNYLFNLAEIEEKQISKLREENIKNIENDFNIMNNYAFIITYLLKSVYIKANYSMLPSNTFILYIR